MVFLFQLCLVHLTFNSIQIANVLVMQDFMDRWPITPLQKGIMSEFWLKTVPYPHLKFRT